MWKFVEWVYATMGDARDGVEWVYADCGEACAPPPELVEDLNLSES